MFGIVRANSVKRLTLMVSKSRLNRGGQQKLGRVLLGMECLEDRHMFSLGTFERTGGEVLAVTRTSLQVGGALVISGDVDDGNLEETNASAHHQDSLITENGSTEGEAWSSAIHTPPIAETFDVAYAAIAAQIKGGSNGGITAVSAEAASIGEYDITDVPVDAVFHGRWMIDSTGDAFQPEEDGIEIGTLNVYTTHHAAITTTSSEGIETWYVHAQRTGSSGDFTWLVTYHLPQSGDGSFVVSDGFSLVYDEVWAYDDSFKVKVEALGAPNHIVAQTLMGTPLGHEASVLWKASTQAFLTLESNGDSLDPGGFDPPLPEIAPPKVANVAISSTVANSYGTNPPYDFDNVAGSEEQFRTVSVGAADRIAVQFTKGVNIVSGDLDLIALSGVVSEPHVSSFVAPDASNNYTATWTLSTALPSAQYLLRLSDSIQDSDGQMLDGEWTNPGSVNASPRTTIFPSGDNVAGGDFEFIFVVNRGDFNRDGAADGGDLNILLTHYFGTSKSFSQGDATGDGIVDGSDLNILLTYYWLNLQELEILGDYDGDFDLEDDDETDFLAFYNAEDTAADLNGDNAVDQADYDAFFELFAFGVDLNVLT